MYTLIYKRKKLQRLNKPIIAVAAVLYMLALMVSRSIVLPVFGPLTARLFSILFLPYCVLSTDSSASLEKGDHLHSSSKQQIQSMSFKLSLMLLKR